MAETNTGFMSCELKLDTNTSGWHKTMTKVLMNIKGVSYTIDTQAGIAHVSGTIDPDTLLKLLAKAGKHAELLRVDSGYKHQFYTAKPAVNYRSGHGNHGGYYNNRDYGYYNPNGTYAATDLYRHPQYYPNYYEQPTAPPLSFPQPPPPKEIHPFYDPDAQCTIM